MNEFNEKKIEFKKSISFPCSYLAGKTERRLYVNLNKNENNKLLISELTKNGFRRSHEHMYIPVCERCNACIPSRINTKDFKFSKNNLRVVKLNSDLSFKKNFDNRNINFDINDFQKKDALNRDLINKKEKLEQEKKSLSKTKDKSNFEKSKKISKEISELEKNDIIAEYRNLMKNIKIKKKY